MSKFSSSKSRMIAKTAELLQTQGYHATGLTQIVEESGTPKGSLYFHFAGGKEELAAEAVRTAGTAFGREIEAVLASADDIADAVDAAIRMLARNLEESGFRKGCPVATVALEAATTSDRLQASCREAFQFWLQLIERRLIGSGFTPTEAGARATLILAAIEGALMLSKAERNAQPLITIGAQLNVLLKSRGSNDL